MKFKSFIALAAIVILPLQVLAQPTTSCGEQPIKPAIVDGATSTMEQLIANSKEVNAYIAEADQFLDCSETRYKKVSSSRTHKDEIAEEIKSLTALRNEIGDEFNDQVAAFKVANPQ